MDDLCVGLFKLPVHTVLYKFILRVYQQFFDLTLKTHNSWTGDATPNPIFLLKHLTPRVYADSMLTDIVPSSGGNEPIKIETLNAIGSCHDYPFETKLPSLDCKLNFLFKMDFFILISSTILSKFTVWLAQFAYKHFNLYFSYFHSTFERKKVWNSRFTFYSLEWFPWKEPWPPKGSPAAIDKYNAAGGLVQLQ